MHRWIKSALLLFTLEHSATHIHAAAELSTRVIYATQDGGPVRYQGKSIRTEEMSTAVRKARPGDRVLLLPGTYTKRLLIQKEGLASHPIEIVGIDGLTLFSCNDLPTSEGNSALRISTSKYLSISGLSFRNCWPGAIEISDSQYIDFRDTSIQGSKTAVNIKERSTHHIWISGFKWQPFENTDLLNDDIEKLKQSSATKDHLGSFVHLDGVDGDIFIDNNQSGHAFRFVTINSIAEPYPATQRIMISGNQVKGLRDAFLSIDGRLASSWITDNTIESAGSLITQTGTGLESLVVVNNQFTNYGTNEGAVFRLSEKSKNSSLLIAHNVFQSNRSLFNDLEEGYEIKVAANHFGPLSDKTSIVGSHKRLLSALKLFDDNLYDGADLLSLHRAKGFDKRSVLSSAPKKPLTELRKLMPKGVRFGIQAARNPPGTLALRTSEAGPWPESKGRDRTKLAVIIAEFQTKLEHVWVLDQILNKPPEKLLLQRLDEQLTQTECRLTSVAELICPFSLPEGEGRPILEITGESDTLATIGPHKLKVKYVQKPSEFMPKKSKR